MPSAGEVVIFDRSWYNRAGVERVMGFCTQKEYERFLRTCPDFEASLVLNDIVLIEVLADGERRRSRGEGSRLASRM